MFFERQKIIKDIISFGPNRTNETFNVAYGIDKNFLFGSMISMTSLLMHNSYTHFSFHIITDYIDDDYNLKIQQLSQQYDADITVYLVDCDELRKLPSTKNWSHAMYFRFLAVDFINIQGDRILYLDADITCNNSIQELMTINLDDNIAAVVKDGNADFWQERAKFFNVSEIANGYFNSGVMLIQLKNWADNKITEKAIKMLSDPDIQKKLTFPDQDVLNILLCKEIIYLEHIYNTQTSINFELQCKKNKNYDHPISDETVFIHYIGPTKPWHKWARYPIAKYFNFAKNNSPWKDSSLINAHSSSLLRYQAKHQLHQGRYIQGLLKYLSYFYAKIK